MANSPIIRVNSYEVPHWASVQIDRTIDALTDTFSFSYNLHERVSSSGVNVLVFDGDEPVTITLDGETLLTGFLDNAAVDISADGTSVQFAGYSRTADLVACQIIPKTIRFADKTVESIAKTLCEPFEVEVEVDESASADANTLLETFKGDFGEQIHEALLRLAAYRGLLVMPTPEGRVRLTRAGSHKVATVLRLGDNIKRVRVVRDARDRFSEYYVVSPDAGGFDLTEGKVAVARDPGVGRYRPIIVQAEQDVRTHARRIAQGEWERNRRVGDSLRIAVEFPQWRNSDGIWSPNDLVQVEINKGGLSINREMVVAGVSLTRDAQASSVSLELVHPASLAPRELPLPRRSKARAKAADDFPSAPEVYQFDATGYTQDFVEQFGLEGGLAPEDYPEAELDPWGT